MESNFISWANGFNINLGTLIAIIVVVFGFGSFCYRTYTNYKKKLNDAIDEKADSKNSEEDFKNTINDLIKSVNMFNESLNKTDKKLEGMSNKIDNTDDMIKNNNDKMSNMSDQVSNITVTVETLLESDRESIRSFILSEYYKWSDKKSIDLYALNALEYKYDKYKKEHGNTFVKSIMHELRSLPKTINVTKEDGTDPLGYFEDHPEVLEEMAKHTGSDDDD